MKDITRRTAVRTFASISVAAYAGLGAAQVQSRSPVGAVSYCFGHTRQALRQSGGKDIADPRALLEHAQSMGFAGIQAPLGVLDADEALALRRRAEAAGMYIEGIVRLPRNAADTARFDAELETAAACGAAVVRTTIIAGRRYEEFRSMEAYQRAVAQGEAALKLALPAAERRRIRIALENHKDQRVPERLDLFKRIGSPWLGACIDLGNSIALLEDPMAVVEAYAPYAAAVHVKDQGLAEYADGFLLADVPLGHGVLDLRAMAAKIRAANPAIRLSLELITRPALKVPCISPDYWATMPQVPGLDLARTLALARSDQARTQASHISAATQPDAPTEQRNLEASLRWAQAHLTVA